MNRRILCFGFQHQIRRQHARAAIIKNPVIDLRLHGLGITVPGIGARVGTTHSDEVNPQMAQLLLQLVGTEIKCPAIGEHPIDPALEQRWHRPPIDRINQHQGIGAVDSRLFGQYIGRGLCFAVVNRQISGAEPWLEAFGPEIGHLHRALGIGLRQAFGNLCSQAMGERSRLVMSHNDKCVHADTPD